MITSTRRAAAALGILATIGSLSLTSAAAQAQPEPPERGFQLVNVESNQCLAIPNGSKRAGTRAIQWPCNGHGEQKWHWWYRDGGTFSIMNGNSRLCLGSPEGPYAAVPVVQVSCSDGHAITFDLNGGQLVDVRRVKCLAIGNGSHVKGHRAILWRCKGGSPREQLWSVR